MPLEDIASVDITIGVGLRCSDTDIVLSGDVAKRTLLGDEDLRAAAHGGVVACGVEARDDAG